MTRAFLPSLMSESDLRRVVDSSVSAQGIATDARARLTALALRASLAALLGPSRSPCVVHPIDAPVDVRLEDVLDSMRSRSPAAFDVWQRAFEAGRVQYDSQVDRSSSLSVASNPGAEGFSLWVRPWLRGRVLDVGCGPQALPLYLQGYPLDRCAGIDPLEPYERHPFLFRRAFCERIPWPECAFDAVICATSLDHVFDLDRSLREIRRVLAPEGVLLLWISFIDGAVEYDIDRIRAPIDPFHLFHFDRPWFYPLVMRDFDMLEDWAFDSQSHFICLSPRRAVR